MTVTASTLLSLPLITTGTESGVWGSYVNNGLTSYLDNAIAGTVTLTNDGAVTLSNTAGTDTVTNIVSTLTGAGTVSAQFAIIRVTGTLTTAKVLTAPSSSREYIVVNAATGSTVTIKASGQSGVSVAVGETATVYFNGTDYVKSATTLSGTGTVTSVGWTGGIVSVATATTTPAFTIAGTSGGVPYFNSGTTWATSAALAANALVTGGGAGAAPATVTTGTGVVTALGVNTGSAGAFVVNGGALGTPSSGTLSSTTVDGTNAVGYLNIPINSQSAAYTLVLADAGKAILHPSTDANARTFTIPANGSVAYAVGTAITFINMTSQVVTIAITTDTMYLSSAGTTGSRSLAQYGTATAVKITSTSWIISGSGLT